MSACLCVINKVLFTVRNYFGRSPRETISSTIARFFKDDEIFAARGVILSYAEKLEPKSDESTINKSYWERRDESETDDILTIYFVLDARRRSRVCGWQRSSSADLQAR